MKSLSPEMNKLARELAEAVGEEHVSTRSLDRMLHSRDVWPRNTIRLAHGSLPSPAGVVVRPGSTEEVRAVLRLAYERGIPVVPKGAGSGVCGGSVPLSEEAVVLDLLRMNRLLEIDEKSLLMTAEAGIIGEVLERKLNQRGYTLGHFPSSIYCSSFGGWLSTRAAGQLSAKYGKIEDMVVSLQVALPDGGLLETKTAPRSATGPGWKHAFVGAEGTLGVITRGTCRIHPYPRSRLFQAYSFNTIEDGFEAIKSILQAELRPACIRLYDPVDTFFSQAGKIMSGGDEEIKKEQGSGKGGKKKKRSSVPAWASQALPLLFRPSLINPVLSKAEKAKLILTFEGDPEITALEKSIAKGICARKGGKDLGEAPARRWWEKRYKVSYAMQVAFSLGLFVDTIEVATGWDNLARLYYEMKNAIKPHAFVMAHFSHAYPQGCSIYFTIAATGRNEQDKLNTYDRVWRAALDACVRAGGTISHHHGVGLLKAEWMKDEKGGAFPLLAALKKAADPKGLMNPGKLGLS